MTAAIFQTETARGKLADPTTSDDKAWEELLLKLENTTRQKAGPQRGYIDGLIRVVSDEDIVIKKNERRLWTRSAARDDAEATMVAAMHLHSSNGKRGVIHG